MQVPTFSGKRYFLSFIDDKTKYCQVYVLQCKSEAFDKFVQFVNLVQNKIGVKIKTLQSDNGGEYVSKNSKNILSKME